MSPFPASAIDARRWYALIVCLAVAAAVAVVVAVVVLLLYEWRDEARSYHRSLPSTRRRYPAPPGTDTLPSSIHNEIIHRCLGWRPPEGSGAWLSPA